MKKLLIILLTLNSSILFSQIVVLQSKIINESGFDLIDFTIYQNTTEINPSKVNQFITFPVKLGDTITIKHSYYENGIYIVPSRTNEDTLKHIFLLFENSNSIDEVVISAKYNHERQKKIAGKFDENIIDYIVNPTSNTLITIKSYKKEYFIDFKNDTIFKTHKLTFKPTSIELDCVGNIHILTLDSAFQIYFTENFEIQFITTTSKKIYNSAISKLVSMNENVVYYQRNMFENTRYVLTKQPKDDLKTELYATSDESTYSIPKQKHIEIISEYYSTVEDSNNIIRLGTWDGDYSLLAINESIDEKISLCKNTFIKPVVSCYSFGMLEYICTINLNQKILLKIDYENEYKTVLPIDIKNLKNIILSYDYFYDKVYIICSNGKTKMIFSLNEKTGNIQKTGDFEGIVFANHIKIYGDAFYYLKRNDAGFNKLYKVKFKK